MGYDYDFPKCELCLPGTVLTSDKKNCIPCKKKTDLTCSCEADEIQGIRKVQSYFFF